MSQPSVWSISEWISALKYYRVVQPPEVLNPSAEAEAEAGEVESFEIPSTTKLARAVKAFDVDVVVIARSHLYHICPGEGPGHSLTLPRSLQNFPLLG